MTKSTVIDRPMARILKYLVEPSVWGCFFSFSEMNLRIWVEILLLLKK